MKKIEEIDKNFKRENSISKEERERYSIDAEPFKIYGVKKYDGSGYLRMPPDIAEKVSENVAELCKHTAGGRVTFATDSRHIGVSVKYNAICRLSNFSTMGCAGLDMYMTEGEKYTYMFTFAPQPDETEKFEQEMTNKVPGMHSFMINLPLYSAIERVDVVLDSDARIGRSEFCYEQKPPIVYYGSSITQGGCASRPGNSYQSMISRELKYDYINLGFSGSALGEEEMAKYIAGLEVSAFVYDYSYNAPDADYLEKTHERMLKIIREKHPKIPVLCLTQPDREGPGDELAPARDKIIEKTVIDAKKAGDNNIYFVNVGKYCAEASDGGISVDGVHPNDWGFRLMADVIGRELKKVLSE